MTAARQTSRAVQRSIHDTHTEDRADAAKGDAMASVCDIANAVEAQDVGGERAQACKDARIAADAAGVFCEATVADVVRAVFYAPVVAYGVAALSGWQNDVADEQCSLAGRAPSRLTRITALTWPSHSVAAKLLPGVNTSTMRVSSRDRHRLSVVWFISSGSTVLHSSVMA